MFVESNVVFPREYFAKRRVSNFLIVFFLIYQAIGLDFGFASGLKRKYQLFVQRTSICVTILSFIIMIVYLTLLYDDIWCWLNSVRLNSLILILITTRYKLYHLIYDINMISTLTTKQATTLNILIILYTIFTYGIKIPLMTVRCILEKGAYCGKFKSIFHYSLIYGIVLSLDVIAIIKFIITYHFKCSVNLIKELLKKPNRKIEVFEKSYMALADCYDKIRPFYDWLVS